MLRMRQPSDEQTPLRSTTTILRRSARPGTPAVGLAAAGLRRPRIPAARQALVSLLLAAATVAAFFPVADNGFIDYDDQDYVTQNDHVRQGLTASGALWAFTHSFSSNWHPVTWLSHMLDCQLFGLNAGAHHATSLFFHIANSLLLFLLFARMTGALWPSALVSGLFALHPLHVESVAWISERKDLSREASLPRSRRGRRRRHGQRAAEGPVDPIHREIPRRGSHGQRLRLLSRLCRQDALAGQSHRLLSASGRPAAHAGSRGGPDSPLRDRPCGSSCAAAALRSRRMALVPGGAAAGHWARPGGQPSDGRPLHVPSTGRAVRP